MKKSLLILSLMSVLTACSSNQDPISPIEMVTPECAYPDAATIAAPTWVCSAPVEGISISAVGSSKIGGAGVGFAKQQAATAARVELAQAMKTQINNMIKQYTETTGFDDGETVDQVLTSVTKQITTESLVGTHVYNTQTSPNNVLYVLVGLDPENANQIAEVAIKNSMSNQKALWQKFQAGKAQEEMAADILKMQQQNQQ